MGEGPTLSQAGRERKRRGGDTGGTGIEPAHPVVLLTLTQSLALSASDPTSHEAWS